MKFFNFTTRVVIGYVIFGWSTLFLGAIIATAIIDVVYGLPDVNLWFSYFISISSFLTLTYIGWWLAHPRKEKKVS